MLAPVAFQISRRTGPSPSSRLMPISFGAPLGGTLLILYFSPL